jgi:short-subunit dehydrogenase
VQTTPPVVLITGASSGIGHATALLLATEGARLVLTGRSESTLTAVADACRARGAEVLVVAADVVDAAEVEHLVSAVVARYGRLDVCVHSAAVVGYGRFEDVPTEVFDRVVETDVLGTANVARSVLRVFRDQRAGNLILMGSILGRIRTPYMSSYVTSKAAVHALARVLTIENRNLRDVHVCLLMPGSVDTPVYRRAANYAGRVGKPPVPVIGPDKVARAVARLIAKPRARVDVGPANKLMALGFTLFPPIYDLLVTPMMKVLGLGRPIAPHDGNVFAPTRADDVNGETYVGRVAS